MKHNKCKKRRCIWGMTVVLVLLMGGIVSIGNLHEPKEEIKHRLQWWLSAIKWDENRCDATGNGITIAVLDAGVDEMHPDINACIEREYRVSGLTGLNDMNVFHGTAVAGIIAGIPSTDKGILGVAPNAKIISVDVTDHPSGVIEVDNLIEGLEYAVEQKVDIINISAGVKHSSEKLEEAVKQAYDAGVVIIAASGNFMKDNLLYPAKYRQVIAVGSRAKNEEILSPKGNVQKTVVYLPGENIVTAGKNHGYCGISGTSASAPILSGIVALIKEKNKELTNDKIISYFNESTNNITDVGKCIRLE